MLEITERNRKHSELKTDRGGKKRERHRTGVWECFVYLPLTKLAGI